MGAQPRDVFISALIVLDPHTEYLRNSLEIHFALAFLRVEIAEETAAAYLFQFFVTMM